MLTSKQGLEFRPTCISINIHFKKALFSLQTLYYQIVDIHGGMQCNVTGNSAKCRVSCTWVFPIHNFFRIALLTWRACVFQMQGWRYVSPLLSINKKLLFNVKAMDLFATLSSAQTSVGLNSQLQVLNRQQSQRPSRSILLLVLLSTVYRQRLIISQYFLEDL